MNKTFDINQDELIAYTKKLSKLRSIALPLAVRGSLNDVAFKSRGFSLRRFRKNFDVKPHAKTFARAHILTQKCANVKELKLMESQIGMKPGKKNIGERVSRQEKGAQVKKRTVPMRYARVGNNSRSPINKRLYSNIFKNKTNGIVYKSGESKIVKTDNSLIRYMRGGEKRILYLYDRSFKLDSKPFISYGAMRGAQQMPKIYKKQAEFRIKKEMQRFMK